MIGKIKLYKLYIITVFFTFFCYAPFLNYVYVQAADINNNIESDFKYIEIDDYIEIQKYIGNEEIVEVPSYINGVKVMSIEEEAFRDNNKVREITILNGIKIIKNAVFINCNNLEKVTLPSSINSIGDSAFSQCKKLTTIFMPKRMQYLGNNVFEGCESLESIDIPEGVSRIGYDFAANCYSLNSVNIPSSVNTLSPGAFSGCLNLKVIEIPESVTTIQAPFQDLKQLTIIGEKGSAAEKHAKAIGLDFKEYGTEANVSENIYNDFQYSENSTQVEITKYLGSDKNVIIPKYINNKKVTSIAYGCFMENNDIEAVQLPKYMEIVNSKAFYHCVNLQKVYLNDHLKKIKNEVFFSCTSLNNISMPNSLESIGESAFEGCENITKIYIPKSVVIIEPKAFDKCSKLEVIDVDCENRSYSSINGILYSSNNGGGYINLLRCPEGYRENTIYIDDNVNYIRFDAFANTNVKYIFVRGKYIDVQELKETILEKLIQQEGIENIGEFTNIEVSIEFLLSQANSSDEKNDVELEVSFNIYNNEEGKVVVINNKNNTVGVHDISKVINNSNDLEYVINKEISDVNKSDNYYSNNSNNNMYQSIKELSSNILLKEVEDTAVPIISNNSNDIIKDNSKDNIKQSNDADYYLNDIKVNEDSYKNSSKKWSNTRDFFYIFSFFAVITIIGWILLNMVKYKKRCS